MVQSFITVAQVWCPVSRRQCTVIAAAIASRFASRAIEARIMAGQMSQDDVCGWNMSLLLILEVMADWGA